MLKRWSEEELREASALAVEHFIESRLSEPTRKYEELLAESVRKVTEQRFYSHSAKNPDPRALRAS